MTWGGARHPERNEVELKDRRAPECSNPFRPCGTLPPKGEARKDENEAHSKRRQQETRRNIITPLHRSKSPVRPTALAVGRTGLPYSYLFQKFILKEDGNDLFIVIFFNELLHSYEGGMQFHVVVNRDRHAHCRMLPPSASSSCTRLSSIIICAIHIFVNVRSTFFLK